MPVSKPTITAAVAGMSLACSGSVLAQETVASLLGGSVSSLRGEMQSRYDDALALTQDPAIVGTDNVRYMWATQAKVQCGIAIGYTKSGYKDPVSVGKCVDAHLRMQQIAATPLPEPPALCKEPIAGTIYFEWDSATPPPSSSEVIDAVVAKDAVCDWSSISVVGHTDRSGSDAYNERLAARRAEAVANLLEAKGIVAEQKVVSSMGERDNKVPTEDGVRELQNRRVEVTVF